MSTRTDQKGKLMWLLEGCLLRVWASNEWLERFPLLRTQFAKIVRSIADGDAGVSVPNLIHPRVQSLGGVIGLLAAHERRHFGRSNRF